MNNALLVLLGPTGTGKTELSLTLAAKYGAPIISADSRQLYKDLPVGTAAPTPVQLAQARHYMVGTLSLTDYYSASRYEEEVLSLLQELFKTHATVLMAGGSMMYLDAICKGLDEIPTVAPGVRQTVWEQYEQNGLAPLLDELKTSDPVHYRKVDRMNHKRVIHAVEICRMTGRPYSSFCTHRVRKRPFRIIQLGLTRPRDELYQRINRRVDQMMAEGLVDEARRVYPHRHLNALNTVGYKELFRYFDGEWPLDTAVEKIKRNTRVYARKQMTWFKRDTNIAWFHPDEKTALLAYVEKKISP
ncbi:MAG: tRNA (adenosine(37)-N6)-dimethylallyltransferase MiaA [Prevotellaceae bacterium]|jgi:tRNA dimethylallyltransferase|nr:tRNA (adenosine(37)-N6)-dimethylallyltransferase MiaA [Prevotellaceae bacterium]